MCSNCWEDRVQFVGVREILGGNRAPDLLGIKRHLSVIQLTHTYYKSGRVVARSTTTMWNLKTLSTRTISRISVTICCWFLLQRCSALVLRGQSTAGAASTFLTSISAINDNNLPIDRPNAVAYPQQTPHSGRHFYPSHPSYPVKWYHRIPWVRERLPAPQKLRRRQRFMEGWYYRLTLREHDNVSFAFIFSIEDAGRSDNTDLALCAVQVMGPNDEYLVQSTKEDNKFWAWEHSQGLGCTFAVKANSTHGSNFSTALSPQSWRENVETGFQMLPTSLQGRIDGNDGSLGSVRDGIPGTCSWDITIQPKCGWGNVNQPQKSTAGWLAKYPVFEPHWQVTLADATASGIVIWKNKTFHFREEPFYAEKNWGGSFPIKWYWVQCNAFDNFPGLTVTAGGGVRKLPFLPGSKTEELGMVCIHYNGTFFEAVPWTGDMSWEVSPWGKWILRGRCTSGDRLFETELIATCDRSPGVVLRAPTEKDGLVYFCRDSFLADVTLSIWPLQWSEKAKDYVRCSSAPIIESATSTQGGVEVGGGPWWDTWKGTSRMRQPMKALVRLPYILDQFKIKLKRKHSQ